MTFKNSHVKNQKASAAVYRVHGAGSEFEYRSEDPALEYSGDGLLKKGFQNVHRGDADTQDTERFLSAYGTDLGTFKSVMRTVGVGTNILLREGEGQSGRLEMPMVGRTQTGPDGTVALGKQSRAAGGADGSLTVSGFRELSEEFIVARDGNSGELIIYNLVYTEPGLSHADTAAILREKNAAAERMAQSYGLSHNGLRFETLEGKVLGVAGLTQTITQYLDGAKSSIQHRVLTDNPSVGDFAGVDTILLAELPKGMAMDHLMIRDGEEDFDGNLLKREWTLNKPEAWIEQIRNGMPTSPAPRKVLENWDVVEQALRHNI